MNKIIPINQEGNFNNQDNNLINQHYKQIIHDDEHHGFISRALPQKSIMKQSPIVELLWFFSVVMTLYSIIIGIKNYSSLDKGIIAYDNDDGLSMECSEIRLDIVNENENLTSAINSQKVVMLFSLICGAIGGILGPSYALGKYYNYFPYSEVHDEVEFEEIIAPPLSFIKIIPIIITVTKIANLISFYDSISEIASCPENDNEIFNYYKEELPKIYGLGISNILTDLFLMCYNIYSLRKKQNAANYLLGNTIRDAAFRNVVKVPVKYKNNDPNFIMALLIKLGCIYESDYRLRQSKIKTYQYEVDCFCTTHYFDLPIKYKEGDFVYLYDDGQIWSTLEGRDNGESRPYAVDDYHQYQINQQRQGLNVHSQYPNNQYAQQQIIQIVPSMHYQQQQQQCQPYPQHQFHQENQQRQQQQHLQASIINGTTIPIVQGSVVETFYPNEDKNTYRYPSSNQSSLQSSIIQPITQNSYQQPGLGGYTQEIGVQIQTGGVIPLNYQPIPKQAVPTNITQCSPVASAIQPNNMNEPSYVNASTIRPTYKLGERIKPIFPK